MVKKHTHTPIVCMREQEHRVNRHQYDREGGEAVLRNSIITFSSLARRLEAQTVAVSTSSPPPSAALGSSLRPGLCLLHRTNAFCRQPRNLKRHKPHFSSLNHHRRRNH